MDARSILMGVAFAFMWSSAFTSARIIVADAPPLLSLSVRFLLSGLIAIAIARAMGQSWHLTRPQWIATLIFGICQNALYLGLNFVAMQTVEASLAAIIASSLPLWVGLAGWLVFKERIPFVGILGLLGGFAGVALIMGTRLGAGVDPAGVAMCVAGVLALTFATLLLRGASSGGNVLMIVGLQMLVGSISLIGFGLALEPLEVRMSWPLIIAFTYTLFIPGLAATWLWFVLVRRIGTVRAATFHFLNPVFGVVVAAVILGETLGPLDLVGVGVITIAILVVQLSRSRAT